MWTSEGRVRGGLRGGRRVHQLHPGMARENGRKVHEVHPEQGHDNGVKAMHRRWHLARGVSNPKCELCRRKTVGVNAKIPEPAAKFPPAPDKYEPKPNGFGATTELPRVQAEPTPRKG